MPIAAVSLVGPDQEYFRGLCGLNDESKPRKFSFCGHAILERGVFYVPDASHDERFADTGKPGLLVYTASRSSQR